MISELFERQFGQQPSVCVRAPGRVNLIGEHIDYNGGHVMPLAISCAVEVAATPRSDGRFRLFSAQFGDMVQGSLPSTKQGSWTDYVYGVVQEFAKLGFDVGGMDAVFDGSIPRGSGLSSSAALEVATAWVLQSIVGSNLSRQEIALLAQRAENKFVGVNCGIMDQTASACATAGHALLLDCNTLVSSHIPLEFGGHGAVLVAHSGVHRGLSASAYNERRSQCDAALEAIRTMTHKALDCLCAATLEDLEASRSALDDTMFRRARHAITEEARVVKAAAALRSGNLEEMGQLLNESHMSLKEDYEVSCDELDELTARIRQSDGVYGSRLTGAGFGGCTVSIIEPEAAERIIEDLRTNYYRAHSMTPVVFVTGAEDGVSTIKG